MARDQRRFNRLCRIFATATHIDDATRRQAFVTEACRDDRPLADEVTLLLRHYDKEPTGSLEARIRRAIHAALD